MKIHLVRSWIDIKKSRLMQLFRHGLIEIRAVLHYRRRQVLQPVMVKILVVLLLVLSAAPTVANHTVQAEALSLQPHSILARDWEDKVAPQLQEDLAALSEGEMISVIVTLGNQANLMGIIDRNRNIRSSKVIRALQNMANATQVHIIGLLENRKTSGEVEQYESYWVFNGLAVTATAAVIEELAGRPEVRTITPNGALLAPAAPNAQTTNGPLEPNLNLINTQALWDMGFRGQGIVVASMDTGVYLNHPDLVNQWRGGSNSWYDPYGEHPQEPFDVNGHGTWTMGVLVGGEGGGTAIGVAPEAQWMAVKIFNDQGVATVAGIHAGFQWLLDPDGNPNTPDSPHVVNNSWTFQSPGCDLEFELDMVSLRAAGILPIFAAGNSGPNSGTSFSPSNNPSAFAVGATDNNDVMYINSSRGPSSCGESETVFPEITAPGVNIYTSDLYGLYTVSTGTSLAAPHTTGGLALLLEAFPNLLAGEQEAALLNGVMDLGIAGPDNDFGYGRLDLLSSFQWLGSSPTATPTPEPVINLALDKPVAVSSYQDGSHDGTKAVDGDLGTFWQTERAKGKNKLPSEWITVDLGNSESINQVVLEWDSNYATSYTIQVSDDNSSWVTIVNVSNGDGANDTHTFSTISARYVKMESTGWSSGSLRNWLREFEIYANGAGSTPTPTATAEPTATPSPTLPPPGGTTMHINDLDGVAEPGRGGRWDATITILVIDSDGEPVSDATVTGNWINGASGSGSCTTDTNGLCSISKNNIKGGVGSVTFTIVDVSHAAMAYEPAANQDPDGDSDGTNITVTKP